MALTRDQVQQITGDAARWLDALNETLTRWDISTPQRAAMFLAQCAHESGGFRHLVENLHYSAASLLQLWPRRFTADEAVHMAYNEEAIAERAYGGRMGNGPEGSGDGFRYRGRGIIQLTGRDNYRRCGVALGLDLEARPELLEQPEHAAMSAGWFWGTNGLNAFADAGDYEGITRRINGGLNGLADRQAWLNKARAILAVEDTQPAAPIEDRSTEYQPPATPAAQPEGTQMGGLQAAGFIGQLLQAVIGQFSAPARATIEQAAGKVTDPVSAKTLADGLMGVLQQVTGIADPVRATAAVTAPTAEGKAKLAEAEAQSLLKLNELAPFLDQIAALERGAREASDASFDKAAARGNTPEGWKLRWAQTSFTHRMLGYAAVVIAALIALMTLLLIWIPSNANAAVLNLIGQLVVLEVTTIGAFVSTFRDQNGFSFGGTVDSNAAAIARTELEARRAAAGVKP